MSIDVPLVSVIITTRNRHDDLNKCVESICNSDFSSFELIVVDDASDVPVKLILGKNSIKPIIVRNDERSLLSYSRNIGSSISRGKYLFFVDDDNVISTDCISNLVNVMDSSTSISVTSPVAYFLKQPDLIWTSIITKGKFPSSYVINSYNSPKPISTDSFHNAFMIRADHFNSIGRFDEVLFPVHFSETDFAVRTQKKDLKLINVPQAKVWHNISRGNLNVDSTRAFYTLRNRILLLKKHSTRTELFLYLIGILPLQSLFYVIHHSNYSTDNKLKTVFKLFMGIIDGISRPVSRQ